MYVCDFLNNGRVGFVCTYTIKSSPGMHQELNITVTLIYRNNTHKNGS